MNDQELGSVNVPWATSLPRQRPKKRSSFIRGNAHAVNSEMSNAADNIAPVICLIPRAFYQVSEESVVSQLARPSAVENPVPTEQEYERRRVHSILLPLPLQLRNAFLLKT